MLKQRITAHCNKLPTSNDKQGRLKCNKNITTIIDDYQVTFQNLSFNSHIYTTLSKNIYLHPY